MIKDTIVDGFQNAPHRSLYHALGLTDEELSRLSRDKIDIDVWCRELTKEQIDKAHEKGLTVNCWTVDTIEEAEKLISFGIDYITTNILE